MSRKKRGLIISTAIASIAVFVMLLSGCAKTIEMPDLVGMTPDQAVTVLEESGVSADSIVFSDTNNIVIGVDELPKNLDETIIITAQNVQAGEEFTIDGNNQISLKYIDYSDMFRECVNGTAEEAEKIASDNGFKVEYVTANKSLDLNDKDNKLQIVNFVSLDMKDKIVKFKVDTKQHLSELEKEKKEKTKVEAKKEANRKDKEKAEANDEYAKYAKYLSNFKTIEGDGYQVDVDSSIKEDFTSLKNCALYTMKKAYAEYGTMQIGVFGNFDGNLADPAFSFDGVYSDEINIFKDYASPSGWQWVLMPDDIDYIQGK